MENKNENSENENPKKFGTENNARGGRKAESFNKLSKEAKESLLEAFENDLQKLDKLFGYIPMNERFVGMKPVVKMLCTGSDEVSIKTKELIYESLKREFNMLKFYINQLPQEKKAIELRQYLFCLDKEQIEEIFKTIKR
ncbi:hypothetical protein Pf1_00601 [Flavobacterium columnare]|jgi:hypothetical protein|uniref:hypothetical protein n=1 Tax=Flavobacterium columnare TaxID=996 RepID=UPI0007F9BF1B|nr:hypothetical protein [Flavobacterium columnare]ANO48849.1 hypothetical protein Pf1_00601 [Flavobacterium columnare]APT23126.1 hypothetical protein BU993_11185 [Flavobacterium columnare]